MPKPPDLIPCNGVGDTCRSDGDFCAGCREFVCAWHHWISDEPSTAGKYHKACLVQVLGRDPAPEYSR